MSKLNKQTTWKLLTSKKYKLLVNARITIVKATEILESIDKEVGSSVYENLKYSEILHYDESLIVFESGITIEYEDILNTYLRDDLLYLELGSRLMVYLVK